MMHGTGIKIIAVQVSYIRVTIPYNTQVLFQTYLSKAKFAKNHLKKQYSRSQD
jgi:hypothetical protein